MNAFCEACPDKRSANCELPGRLAMAVKDVVDVFVVIGAAHTSPDIIDQVYNTIEVYPEFKYPKVIRCITSRMEPAD